MSVFESNGAKRGVKEKYPFSTLNIGDSFAWGDETNIFNMRASAYQRGIKLGRKFLVCNKTKTVKRVG